jgi:hypothetical protein
MQCFRKKPSHPQVSACPSGKLATSKMGFSQPVVGALRSSAVQGIQSVGAAVPGGIRAGHKAKSPQIKP